MTGAMSWLEGPHNTSIYPLGDRAMVVQFGEEISRQTHDLVRQLANHLDQFPFAGLVEYVPSYLAVTVYYDPSLILGMASLNRSMHRETSAYEVVTHRLIEILNSMERVLQGNARQIEIPVCYGGEYGPDLAEVAAYHTISDRAVVQIHSECEYVVYMLGFVPGFAYLGGMSERIATPRKATPRVRIPEGSVGIAGSQTGVYPIETPGGWQLIGQTPLRLFLPEQTPPSLLQAGDVVRFYPIERAEFVRIQEKGG